MKYLEEKGVVVMEGASHTIFGGWSHIKRRVLHTISGVTLNEVCSLH